jgi:CubicO group peptidase (beta-lactamase class C family)
MVSGQDNMFMGYATCKIKNEQIEVKAYGFKNRDKTKNYDTLTIQPVGSVSKIVIGLAIMKAQELGLLNIDTDIQQYVNFKVSNPNVKDNIPITLRHLATHTSGIKDNEKFYAQSYINGLKPSQSLGDYIESYITEGGSRYSKKNFGKYKTGEQYSYSNIGAALAAYIIECAAKLPFDQFTEKHIFQPLGMKNTHWFYNENQMDRYSELFDEKDKPLEFYSLTTYPDGSLKTNIIDLSKLLQTLMNGYQGKSDLFDRKSWDLFFTKNFSETNPIKEINPKEPNSGIFIVYAKSGSIGHTGSDPGVSTIMFFDPQTKEGKIFMANEDITSLNLHSFKQIWSDL